MLGGEKDQSHAVFLWIIDALVTTIDPNATGVPVTSVATSSPACCSTDFQQEYLGVAYARTAGRWIPRYLEKCPRNSALNRARGSLPRNTRKSRFLRLYA